MSITKNHGGLVKDIAKFLNRKGLRDNKIRTADLGVVISLISQADYNDRITIPVGEKLINDSFKFKEDAEDGGRRSVLPLAMLLDSHDKHDKTFLLAEKRREKREDGSYGKRITTIGVFSTVRNAEQAKISPILRWDAHHTVVGSLVGWLEKESKRCQGRSKSKKKKRESVEDESSSNKVQRISPTSKESIIGGLGEVTLEEVQKALVQMRTAEDEKLRTSVLHYSLNGVAGTMKINPAGFVLASELVANCEELHYEDSETSRVARINSQWHIETFGLVQVMVPNKCSIVSNSHMSRLNKCKEMIKRLRHLFRGKRCRFKWDNTRYLAAFGLHNLGGSVKGLQMAVAPTPNC